ncbi:MAG TPA: histidinol-phosphate transaminase [Fibrobacteraceae bacterium]|nr:histidinol-phosphate transaminase [Fibrobacteraceae bacterium]
MIPLRAVLTNIHDYVPGKSIDEIKERHGLSEVIKLASNENPLGPSPKAKEAYLKASNDLQLYPRGDCPQLRQALSAYLKIPEDHIVLGNGSDEVLLFIAEASLGPGTEALTCTPTFSLYEAVTVASGAEFQTLPLKNWAFDLDALQKAITPDTRVLFICNPNNPTGAYVGREALLTFLRSVPDHVLIVLDQAYSEFADASDYSDLLDYLDKFPNLLLVRTFSKVWGLAGLRIGYGIGSPDIIAQLWKVKPPFNVNLAAQAAAAAALKDQEHFQRSLTLAAEGKKQLQQGLAELKVGVLPSQANFLALRCGEHCPQLVSWLESKGMIVRGLSNFGLSHWLRLSVGLESQNQRFLELLAEARKLGVF